MVEQSSDVVRLVVIVVAVLVLTPLLGMTLMMGMMGTAWGGPGGAWSPMTGLGVSLLWVGVAVLLGYLAYRAVTARADDRDPALVELRSAYARGELTDEEYETRHARLTDEE